MDTIAKKTPSVNASSKGHLPIVNYLLTKQNADPLVRNKWGETAYDIAASVFEIWISQVYSVTLLPIVGDKLTLLGTCQGRNGDMAPTDDRRLQSPRNSHNCAPDTP
jgi:hypothetical protein